MDRRGTLRWAGALGAALLIGSVGTVPAAPLRFVVATVQPVVGSASAAVAAELERAAADGLAWLTLANRELTDDRGRRVLLRGFNTTALLEWPRQPVARLDEDDAELMRRSGFNVVRLPMAWSSLEPTRGHVNVTYLERIATTVAMLNRHGLYVVLDLHVSLAWSPAFDGAGAPRWATVPLVPHLRLGEAGQWLEAASPAALAANTNFWLDADWQSDFQLVWRAIANRFKDSSGVVGYDLFNEPSPAPLPPGVFEEHWLWPFYRRTIAVVHEADPHHPVFIEAPILFGLAPRVLPLASTEAIYSPHVYTGSLAPPAFAENPNALIDDIRRQATEGRALSGAAWWGELGIDNGVLHAAVWTDTALDTLDDLDAGWAWWQWRQDWGWGIRNHRGDFVNVDFLRHVARPYLAAAPEGVRAGRGDGLRGELRLTVAATHADEPAVVAWPGSTLGRPRVSGTCVTASTWTPESGEVRLAFAERAGCDVSVTVR